MSYIRVNKKELEITKKELDKNIDVLKRNFVTIRKKLPKEESEIIANIKNSIGEDVNKNDIISRLINISSKIGRIIKEIDNYKSPNFIEIEEEIKDISRSLSYLDEQGNKEIIDSLYNKIDKSNEIDKEELLGATKAISLKEMEELENNKELKEVDSPQEEKKEEVEETKEEIKRRIEKEILAKTIEKKIEKKDNNTIYVDDDEEIGRLEENKTSEEPVLLSEEDIINNIAKANEESFKEMEKPLILKPLEKNENKEISNRKKRVLPKVFKSNKKSNIK